MISIGHYPIKSVFKHTGKKKVVFDNVMVKMDSQRYHNFKRHGIKCKSCGIEGQYFSLESHDHQLNKYHFNLYAMKNGERVLMTKDHIKPKSKGGKNTMDNYQTMCMPCNNKKGNSYKV